MSTPPDVSVEMWSVARAMSLVGEGKLGLPDFQRRFEWTAADVRAYLATVLSGLPSGTLMVTPNKSIKVALRPLEGASQLESDSREIAVVLDGQQRLTALFQALEEVGPERYFVDFSAIAAGAEILQDEVVVSFSSHNLENRLHALRTRGTVLVPFAELRNSSTFFSWLHSSNGDLAQKRKEFGTIFARQLQPVDEYRMPVTVLGGDLRLATVAQVFERLNKWGQRLDAFDLLVARLQSTGWNLRGAWDDALQSYPAIGRVLANNGLSVVSAISLRLASDVRRSAILSLPPVSVPEYWEAAVAAGDDVAQLLVAEGFRKPELIPYDAIVTAMIAARMTGVNLEPLKRYLWRAAANRRYEVASNTAVVSDFHDLVNGVSTPDLAHLNLDVEMIERSTRRSSRALWATLTSLLLSRNPLDLATGEPLTDDDPAHEETWQLTSLAKGGRLYETETDVPVRLRTAAQLFSTPSGLRQMHRQGLVGLIEGRLRQPELIGPDIDECLQSQLMPSALRLANGMSLAEVVHTRSVRMMEALQNKVGR